MLSRRMTKSCIGIGAAPGEDGSTIDNEIASTDQMAAHGMPDSEDEERLKGRRSLPFASVCTAGKGWECAGSHLCRVASHRPGQSRPTREPIMHILIGRSPQRFEQSDEQQRRFAIAAGATTCAFRQRRWATPMRDLNDQATQRQQMQRLRSSSGR